MDRTFGAFVVAALVICFLPGTDLRAEYQSPLWMALPYEAAQTSLSPQERSQMADALADYARSLAGTGEKEDALRAKAIALALRLDSDNKMAVLANTQFKKGTATPTGAPSLSQDNLEKMFLLRIGKMQEKTSGQDAKLAAYILDFLSSADPANADLAAQAAISVKKSPVNWMSVLDPAHYVPSASAVASHPASATNSSAVQAPGTTAPKFIPSGSGVPRRSTAQVRGMQIAPVAGDTSGGVMDVILTASTFLSTQSSNCSFAKDAGSDLYDARDEAYRLALSRHPEFQKNCKFIFSFSDKYNKKAVGSAGIAFAVDILSVMEDFAIDPFAAVSGDVIANGKTRKTSGVVERLRGAKQDGCAIAGVPAENEADVIDLFVLDGPSAVVDVQVFSLGTVDDAVSVLRQDRPEATAGAIRLFTDVQDYLSKGMTFSTPEVAAKLDEVLRFAPNHLSAKLLRSIANGTAPRTLTPPVALNQLYQVSSSAMIVFRNLKRNDRFYFTNINGILIANTKGDFYSSVHRQLAALEKKMPQEIEGVYYALVSLLDHVEGFDSQYRGMPHVTNFTAYLSNTTDLQQRKQLQEISTLYQNLLTELVKLNYDKDFLDSLQR